MTAEFSNAEAHPRNVPSDDVLIFHLGLQHADQTALALQEAGRLHSFVTTRFYIPNRFPYNLLKITRRIGLTSPITKLSRRSNPALNPERIDLISFYEFFEAIFIRPFLKSAHARLGDMGYRYFVAKAKNKIKKSPSVSTVWGFNNYSKEIFEYSKRAGKNCVLDLTIGYTVEEEIRQAEHEKQGRGWARVPVAVRSRQIAEVRLADMIVVGSNFVKSTLTHHGVAPEKISVVPYGFDPALFPRNRQAVRRFDGVRPLEVLFVGQIHERKGADKLIEAAKRFEPRELQLTLIGKDFIDVKRQIGSHQNIKAIDFLPQQQLIDHMLNADLFCLPSLFEGSALVIYEAIATGLPVLYSSSAGHSLEGKGGVKLDTVSADAIVEKLSKLRKNAEQIEALSIESCNAYDSMTWDRYRIDVAQILDRL